MYTFNGYGTLNGTYQEVPDFKLYPSVWGDGTLGVWTDVAEGQGHTNGVARPEFEVLKNYTKHLFFLHTIMKFL